jgi:hypothetical protein
MRHAMLERSLNLRHVALTSPAGDPTLVDLLTELRSSVIRHVQARRAGGVALDLVLPEIRELVRHALSREDVPDATETLLGQVLRWSLDAYFDEPALRHVPRFY